MGGGTDSQCPTPGCSWQTTEVELAGTGGQFYCPMSTKAGHQSERQRHTVPTPKQPVAPFPETSTKAMPRPWLCHREQFQDEPVRSRVRGFYLGPGSNKRVTQGRKSYSDVGVASRGESVHFLHIHHTEESGEFRSYYLQRVAKECEITSQGAF